MHFSEIVNLQFEKKNRYTLLCILLFFRIIVAQLSRKSATLEVGTVLEVNKL